jgi:hypothetical protein
VGWAWRVMPLATGVERGRDPIGLASHSSPHRQVSLYVGCVCTVIAGESSPSLSKSPIHGGGLGRSSRPYRLSPSFTPSTSHSHSLSSGTAYLFACCGLLVGSWASSSVYVDRPPLRPSTSPPPAVVVVALAGTSINPLPISIPILALFLLLSPLSSSLRLLRATFQHCHGLADAQPVVRRVPALPKAAGITSVVHRLFRLRLALFASEDDVPRGYRS